MSEASSLIRGLRVGRIAGIPIEVDASWFLIAGLLTLALRSSFGLRMGEVPEWALWLSAGAAALIFLASVLIHELSHSVVAARRGIPVRRIRLFIFGGVSEIGQEATSARDEFAIAVVGPAASIVLSVVFFGLSILADPWPVAAVPLSWLAAINLVLGVFNLLPGLPLDGGRVLKSIIWRRTGSVRRAVRVSATSGQVLGFVLIGSGVALFPLIGLTALWNVFIGWYLYQGALVARAQADLKAVPDDLTAAQIMQPQGSYVTPSMSRDRFLETYGESDDDTWFPVIDAWGEPHGAVTVGAARRGSESTATIGTLMTPVSPGDVVPATTPVRQLLGSLRRRDQVFVLMRDDTPAGVLTAVDLERWLSTAG